MAKPFDDSLAIVTATMNPTRAKDCFASWLGRSTYHHPVYVVQTTLPGTVEPAAIKEDTREVLTAFAPGVTILHRHQGGVVPAFAEGVEAAYVGGAQAVLCLHDDVLIDEDDWDSTLANLVTLGMRFGGFGGAKGLGSDSLYKAPYDPMQLARQDFVSNMRDAEAHGRRLLHSEPCVCFDGFSQFGDGDWFRQAWRWLGASGIQHHFYDGILGCIAARYRVAGWLIPVACHHFGGRTAVADEFYQAWAKGVHPDGDQGFWVQAHEIGYREFADVLPLRVGGRR